MRRFFLLAAFIGCAAVAQTPQPVSLPAPQAEGGKPLMQCLKERKTSREFSPEKLSPQMLSNLLWAAFGINRPDGHRTAPSANNRQEIDIYVATADGLYLYEAKPHRLLPVLAKDLRALTGSQPFVAQAAVNLIYVADFARMGDRPADVKAFYSAANTGFIAQNVYLFCASEGLATVVRGMVPKDDLTKAMGLKPDQRVTLSQTVGYPKK